MNITRILTAVALLTLTACGTSPDTFAVSGTIRIVNDGNHPFTAPNGTDTCSGAGGLADLQQGATVTVTDAAGVTVGVGAVTGSATDMTVNAFGPFAQACVLTFRAEDIPTGKGFYGVEVAHRGRTQYPEDRAKQPIDLTIG